MRWHGNRGSLSAFASEGEAAPSLIDRADFVIDQTHCDRKLANRLRGDGTLLRPFAPEDPELGRGGAIPHTRQRFLVSRGFAHEPQRDLTTGARLLDEGSAIG